MTLLLTGIDLLEVQRLQLAVERHGDRFLRRIFTEKELDQLKGNLPSLAARFAGKEAVAKALATGIGPVSWLEIEILRGPKREPLLSLHGAAKRLADERGVQRWAISLSHTHLHAIAMVVAS
ncbi:MAG TPA: holo-ACP synthase [Anaerolineales bacterium]|nr:holo-ACP synthase [Anaerolineales bacterium]